MISLFFFTKDDSQYLLNGLQYGLQKKLHDKKTSRPEKIQILTLMPSNWSKNKIMTIMEVSKYLIIRAKLLIKKEGILSMPGKKLDINFR